MKNAFSLVEFLIIIAILGLLGALAAPSLLKKKNPPMKGILVKKETSKDVWHSRLGPATNTEYYVYLVETNRYKVTEALYNSVNTNSLVYHE